jgi:threonine aldolase
MRRAMLNAEVGDDGYGEDPTVRALEEAFAERLGKDAAVFVPSGTMANQIALRLLGRPGTRVVAGRRQHVVVYEAGAAGLNSATQFHLVADTDGLVHPDQVLLAVAEAEHHQPPVSSVFIENTHMPAGGVPWPLDTLTELGAMGVPVHLDGARLFNAEVATEVKAADYAAPATTVMCCLSKGLAAPVGSVLAGTRELMAAARVERKRLGGAMRQAGVIAARRGWSRCTTWWGGSVTTTAGRGAWPTRSPRRGRSAGSTPRPCRPTWWCSGTRTRPRCSITSGATASWPAPSAPAWCG